MKRIVRDNIDAKMSSSKAVLIRGVRGCGKTELANEYANSVLDMNDNNLVHIAYAKPDILLDSKKPVLIKDYGKAPELLDTVKKISNKNGDYILTNSYNLKEKEDSELSLIELRPLSLFESGDSNGKISLENLIYNGIEIDGITAELDYEKVAYCLCRGGFPANINKNKKELNKINNEYIKEIIEKDIIKIDGVRRNSELAYNLLKSYTNQISTLSSDRELIDETVNSYGKVCDKTIYNYVKQLKDLFIIEETKGWKVSFRNETTVRLSPKKFFVDPSIGTTLMNIKPEKLVMNFDLYAKLFKNLVYRDLNVYASTFGGRVGYYQDRYDLKSDFVIHLENDEIALVEVQLSDHDIEESIKNLLKIRKLINKEKSEEKDPKAMIIITAGTEAYKTKDGIYVVPIGSLKN